MKERNDVLNGCHDKSSTPAGIKRRDFLKSSAAVAAGSIALPSVFGNVFMVDAAKADAGLTILAPRYYPLEGFAPEIDLQGKLAVITGASRGLSISFSRLFGRGRPRGYPLRSWVTPMPSCSPCQNRLPT